MIARLSTGSRWAVCLAGGSGTRLGEVTRGADGRSVPKQFCSLRGGRSLLEESVLRAGAAVNPERVLVSLSPEHRPFWEGRLPVAFRNVVVQPRARGTAAGVLLPLLEILERDPDATVVLLPADHHLEKEYVLAVMLRHAFEAVEREETDVLLLGVAPEGPETGYGYVLPGGGRGRLREVERFVEKPARETAQGLVERGALWNAFLVVARARALAELVADRQPVLFEALQAAMARTGAARRRGLAAAYDRIDEVDFSRDVLAGSEDRLAVLEVPPCGWTDLGTPERLAACLARLPRRPPGVRADAVPGPWLDLSRALGRVGLFSGVA